MNLALWQDQMACPDCGAVPPASEYEAWLEEDIDRIVRRTNEMRDMIERRDPEELIHWRQDYDFADSIQRMLYRSISDLWTTRLDDMERSFRLLDTPRDPDQIAGRDNV